MSPAETDAAPLPAEIVAYWNRYYGQRQGGAGVRPSQFAAFFVGEVEAGATIVDIGCGNGRDSLFFATAGFRTVGVDASQAAIDTCVAAATRAGLADLAFLCAPVEDPTLGARLARAAAAPGGTLALYARFLLHAITPAQEDHLLAMAAGLCAPGQMFALEFRTLRDVAQAKATPEHFRRFIDPLHFIATASRHGFATVYFVEGFGYAKYRNDDAHVARCILRAGGG